jgi:hypothetical protein
VVVGTDYRANPQAPCEGVSGSFSDALSPADDD